MKQRKNISKAILFAGLLMLNNAANGFYQCVPKSDYIKNEARKVIRDEAWFNNLYNLRSLEDKFKIAKTQVNTDDAWELIKENETSGTLSQGIYRVVVAGGQGGKGGDAHRYGWVLGGEGGGGEVKKEVRFIISSVSFKATIGQQGSIGCNNCRNDGHEGSDGSNGNPSSLSMYGYSTITAGGSGGGGHAWAPVIGSGDNAGVGQPNGQNRGDGYVRIYSYKG